MEQETPPGRIPPPSSNNLKKSQDGSIIKRNPWLIFVALGAILVVLGVWYVTSRVTRAIKRYQELAVASDTAFKEVDTVYREAFKPTITSAKFILHGGVATYRLSDSTGELFSADARLHIQHYEVKSYDEDNEHVVEFGAKEERGKSNLWGNDKGKTDSISFKLNTAPVWDMKITTGATDLNFDLSKFKIRDLSLSGGAAQFVLKLGEPLEGSDITVETGASELTIDIPKDAACSIESTAGLSSGDYPGFTKKENGHYETDNFASAKNKFYIRISGGVSDYKVHRY